MRREVLLNAAARVVSDLEHSGLSAALRAFIEELRTSRGEKRVVAMPFGVLKDYAIRTSSYSADEQKVANILDVSDLADPNTWHKLILEPELGFVFSLQSKVRFAVEHGPKILELLKTERDAFTTRDATEVPPRLQGKELLTVILAEQDGEHSSPARLIAALEAITELYAAFALMHGVADNDLMVLGCDSGSDKSFDFLGIATLMKEVKETIIAIWDRRITQRNMEMRLNVELIAASLPVIEKIESMKRDGTIGPEAAESMKRGLISGTTKFLDAGIYIDGISEGWTVSPRVIAQPSPKLLAAPTRQEQRASVASDNSSGDGYPEDEEEISDEEIRRIRSALKRGQQKKARTKKS